MYLLIRLNNKYLVQVLQSFLYYSSHFIFFLKHILVMPAKVSLFNMKAEPIFDFGTGPRNLAYFNPHGNNILYVPRTFSACLVKDIHFQVRLDLGSKWILTFKLCLP